jgi:hypothetical protein
MREIDLQFKTRERERIDEDSLTTSSRARHEGVVVVKYQALFLFQES